MKKIISFSSLIFILFATVALAASQEVPLNKIAVIVNNSVITQDEINQAVRFAKKQLTAMNANFPPEKELRMQIIDNLIAHELQKQLVVQFNIDISEKEIDDAIKNVAKHNNLTLAQLRQELEKSGKNFKQYREQIREQMAFNRIQQHEVGRNVSAVTDEEVEQFLKQSKKNAQLSGVNEYFLQDIVISLPDNSSSEDIKKTQQKAAQLVKKMRSGEDYDLLVAESNSEGYKLENNDLGWRKMADVPALFADTIKSMKIGEFSAPIQAPNGFHILKLVEHRRTAAKIESYNKDDARAFIYQHKFEEKVRAWLQKMRESAYIKFM